MSLRIFLEPQQGATYEQLRRVATAAEDLGFEAIFRSDHYLKMGKASGLPAYTDAWTTLAGFARDTKTIRFGTLVTPATFRAIGTFPVILAQVDQMSGGRVEVGLGAGWYSEEHDAYGLPFPDLKSRYDLLEDQLELLARLWEAPPGETIEWSGRTTSVHLSADPLRPLQRPHPPVVIGGRGGPRNARLTATYADEFNTAFVPVSKMKDAHDAVRAACEKRGRDPESVVWSTGQVICCGRDEKEVSRRAEAIGREVAELRENALAGTPSEVLEKLAAFTAAGAQRVYLQFLNLEDLDHLQLIAEELRPHASA